MSNQYPVQNKLPIFCLYISQYLASYSDKYKSSNAVFHTKPPQHCFLTPPANMQDVHARSQPVFCVCSVFFSNTLYEPLQCILWHMQSLRSYFKSVKEVKTSLQMIQTLWRALGNAFLAVLQFRTGKGNERKGQHYLQVVSRF